MPHFPSFFLNLNYQDETITVRFARAGDEKTVAELLKAGGKKTDAIYGYAWGNHAVAVDQLLAENFELITRAIAGYFRGRRDDNGWKLLTRKHKDAFLNSVLGNAQANNHANVDGALGNNAKYAPPAIEGYASIGNQNKLFDILTGTCLWPDACFHAALHGQVALVNSILTRFNIGFHREFKQLSAEESKFINCAMDGYIKGRHIVEVGKLLSWGASFGYFIEYMSEKAFDLEDAKILLSHVENKEQRLRIFDYLNRRFSHPELKSISESVDQLCETMKQGFNYLEAKSLLQGGNTPVGNRSPGIKPVALSDLANLVPTPELQSSTRPMFA